MAQLKLVTTDLEHPERPVTMVSAYCAAMANYQEGRASTWRDLADQIVQLEGGPVHDLAESGAKMALSLTILAEAFARMAQEGKKAEETPADAR
jgi:hypothetical protein